MYLFEDALSVLIEEIEFELRGHTAVAWADFLLNPRRLRGSDFLMRWSQGAWSEKCITDAVNETQRYFVLPYGPSGVAPENDVREYELYFERLDKAGLGNLKRPDLLLFCKSDEVDVLKIVESLGGLQELPFIEERHPDIQAMLTRAILAIECENSLWKAGMMPNYESPLKPMKRLGGRQGLKKSAVLPTVILKEEDRQPLFRWQTENKINIHIWHVFFDMAFGLSFDDASRLIAEGLIEPTIQTFQAPGGATTKKPIYKIYHHYAYPLGTSLEEPKLVAEHIIDKNGHILPYVRFEGGRMSLRSEALSILDQLSDAKD